MSTHALNVATVDTPLGPVHVAGGPAGLVAVALAGGSLRRFAEDASRRCGLPVEPGDRHVRAAVAEVKVYFAGRLRQFTAPLDWSGLTGFQRKVLRATAAIPFGTTRSYGELAKAVGKPRAARAVGQALGANPLPLFIPCHRVLASGGALGGFTGGLPIKRRLLAHEGVAAG